jgi:hypothetical protein
METNSYLKANGTINFPLFRLYSFALVSWMKTFDPLFRKSSTAQKFNVIYGNPERVFSTQNLLALNTNERINPPICAVYLKDFKAEGTYNIPRGISVKIPTYLPNGRIDTMNSFKTPKLQTYVLNFSCSFYVEFKSDADFIIYTILRELDNGKFKWLLATNNENQNLYQYIPFKLEGTSDTSTLEPGDAKDLKMTFTMNFSVPWAYLPVDPYTNLTYSTVEQSVTEMEVGVLEPITDEKFDSIIEVGIRDMENRFVLKSVEHIPYPQ